MMELPDWDQLNEEDQRILVAIAGTFGIDPNETREKVKPDKDESTGVYFPNAFTSEMMAREMFLLSRQAMGRVVEKT